jgi:uncharacterized repeat protein (TIGR03843 family)
MIVTEIIGRFVSASNVTLLGMSGGTKVVYKPTAGNRPLWDFDVTTLAIREVLTYRMSEVMGLAIVPETVLGDGPLGPGAVQCFVDEDDGADPVEMIRSSDPGLWPVAVLDLVANNADRKAGHLLAERATGRLYAIDHGLTLHPDDKLRTVLWGFAGHAIPDPLVSAVRNLGGALRNDLGDELERGLGPAETAALEVRVAELLAHPVHPDPPNHRPPIPWPPV